jgi:hypothetical protein
MNFEIAAMLEVLSGILMGWAVAVIVRPDATRPLMIAAAFARALYDGFRGSPHFREESLARSFS